MRRPAASRAHPLLIPALLAVVSLLGLTAALVGDDFYDVLSWLTLAVPVAIALRGILARRPS